MPELQVKKAEAVCFLEAAKLTLEHVGTFRLELSQQGVAGPPELPRLYGDLRRLRDYLQRCVSAYQDAVALDLAPGDASLLVACCRRAVEYIEFQMTERAVTPDERQWLLKKRTLLADWALEIATKPLVELPLHRLAPALGEASRSLTTRLQDKVYGDVAERKKIVPPTTGPLGIAAGLTSFGEQCVAVDPEDDPTAKPLPGLDLSGAKDFSAQSSMRRVDGSASAMPQLFDPRTLRDPRLRSLAAMDLHSYERCLIAGDHRLATVLLASVLECVLLDHAIPRRAELGLSGTPDTWAPHELLVRALGEAALPKDRALAYHLFASRNLLRPALQMVTPAVVTPASLESLRKFAERALHGLGFGAASRSLPGVPSSDHRDDG